MSTEPPAGSDTAVMTSTVLEPVDGVVVTILVDNTSDMLLPDEGAVRRWGLH
jgi:hypothetical protein